MRNTINSGAAFALLGVVAALAAAPAFADTIGAYSGNEVGVTVNGNQISFRGTQPVEVHGSVLVPLRGVFESLGANVDYHPGSGTITADRGNRHIRLPLNSSVATVNGEDQQLSQPAQVVNGTTLVPLRFVAEALGDYVEWQAQDHMVMIQSDQPANFQAHRSFSHPGDDQGTLVTGFVRRVIADSTPMKIVVSVNGTDQVIPITDSVTVRRGVDRDSLQSAAFGDIQRGDHIAIRENAHGRAISLTATTGDRRDDM